MWITGIAVLLGLAIVFGGAGFGLGIWYTDRQRERYEAARRGGIR